MGKTTLSLKLAYDWARGRMPSTFPPVQLVLLIKCRDMKGDILETINDQLLPSDRSNLKTSLSKFIEKQPSEIILVVDGFDETPEAAAEHVMNLLTRKCLRECYVVVTSRQEKGLKVRKYFDTLLEIKGYSINDVKEYVTKYFQDNDPSLAKRLIQDLATNKRLETLSTNPLNTVLLCVVFEDYGGELPSTVTELYDNIVFCITERYCKKSGLAVEDKLLQTSKETLGKLAYEGLLEDTLSFRESNLNADKIQCTKMGFLYQEVSERKIKPDHTYWFLHKTFQEYLAAFYFTNKVERKELTVDYMIEQLQDTTKFMQVLMFVSGMLREKDALLSKDFVRSLGKVLLQSQNMDRNQVVNILCAVLSEGLVNKDVADIIHQFLPENLICTTQYRAYVSRTVPRILDLLCRKDGVNAEVYFDKFSFASIEISTSDLGLICKALKEKLKVRTFLLDACFLSDETANNLADMLSHNSTVEKLDLEGNCFTAEAAKIIAPHLCQNTTLKQLSFAYNNLGDVGVKAITTALTSDTSLTGMAARNNNRNPSFREDGKKGSALHILSLEGTECGQEGASAVAAMLCTNNTLTTLDISYNPLDSKGVTYVAEALKPNRTLNSLDLREADCSNEGAAAIADMLRSNQTLTKLLISNYHMESKQHANKVDKDGAVALADALRVDNSALKELHLSNNDITDEGLKYFAEALLVNTVLDKLCIKYPGDGLIALDHATRARVESRITWDCSCTKHA